MQRNALIALLIFMAAIVACQSVPKGQTPPVKPKPQPTSQAEPEYKLQKEDILRIQILDPDKAPINQPVTVGRDGRITPPFLNPLFVEGLTVTEVREQLTALYKVALKTPNPEVSVTLEQVRRMFAYVTGAVNRPGQFPIRPGDSLLTILSQAGDTLPEIRADIRRATLTRFGSREAIPIDIAALRKGDLSQNYEIKDGDVLNIPEETGLNRVLVWGKVRTPGPVNFIEGMTVMDALTASGGEVPNQSKFSKVVVIREAPGGLGQTTRQEVNIVNYIRKGDLSQNIKLARRDIVFVPDNGNPNLDQLNQVVSALFLLERFGINILRF